MASPTTRQKPSRRNAPRLSREEKKAMTRSRLLDAASAVFARKGLAGASLDDVAEEAGLTKGAVYSNFASKEELIWALLEKRLAEPSNAIPRLVNPSASQTEQATQAGAMFMNLVDQERDAWLLELELLLYSARNPEHHDPSNYLRSRREWAAIIEEQAKKHGTKLPLPAEDLVIGVFALGSGIAMERLLNPNHVPDDLFGRMLAVIFKPEAPAQDKPAPGKAKR